MINKEQKFALAFGSSAWQGQEHGIDIYLTSGESLVLLQFMADSRRAEDGSKKEERA